MSLEMSKLGNSSSNNDDEDEDLWADCSADEKQDTDPDPDADPEGLTIVSQADRTQGPTSPPSSIHSPASRRERTHSVSSSVRSRSKKAASSSFFLKTRAKRKLKLSKSKRNKLLNMSGSAGVGKSFNVSTPKVRMKKARRKPVIPDNVHVPKEIQDMVKGDDVLETLAEKNNLNRVQVKTMIRKLITSPDLLKVMMEKAKDENNPDDPENTNPSPGKVRIDANSLEQDFEPRVTRTKAKNIEEEGGQLDWVLEKIKKISDVTTPCKVDSSLLPLVTSDLPSDDDNDEDYNPQLDPSASQLSDDEELSSVANSEAGGQTPRAFPGMGHGLISPLSGTASISTPVPPEGADFTPLDDPRPSTSTGITHADSGQFKQPISVVRNLNFDNVLAAASPPGPHRVHTRSKVDLSHVPIGQLESSLYPPDVTEDMYENNVEDGEYIKFLYDTWLDQTGVQALTSAAGSGSAREEAEDPDYMFQEQENEDFLDVQDEFKYDRSTKIPRKEVDLLINEIITQYDLDQDQQFSDQAIDPSAAGDHNVANARPKARVSSGKMRQMEKNRQGLIMEYYDYVEDKLISNEPNEAQYQILQHQIAQHVQLLTQMSLLTSNVPELVKENEDVKTMTSEIFSQAVSKVELFNPANLMTSLSLVDSWEKSGNRPSCVTNIPTGRKKAYVDIDPVLIQFMGESTAFLYPRLLPVTWPLPCQPPDQVHWVESEDQLLVMGMEQGHRDHTRKKKRRNADATYLCEYVAGHYLPCKKVNQVRSRIKNMKCRKNKYPNNPVWYFYENNRTAPPVELHFAMDIINPSDVPLKEMAHTKALPPSYSKILGSLSGDTHSTKSTKKASKAATMSEHEIVPVAGADGNQVVRFEFNPDTNMLTSITEKASEQATTTSTAMHLVQAQAMDLIPSKPLPGSAIGTEEPASVLLTSPSTAKPPMVFKSLQSGKSPLKEQRKRILKKYISPYKNPAKGKGKGKGKGKSSEKHVRRIFASPPDNSKSDSGPADILNEPEAGHELVQMQIEDETGFLLPAVNSGSQPEDLVVGETSTGITILDQALQESGISGISMPTITDSPLKVSAEAEAPQVASSSAPVLIPVAAIAQQPPASSSSSSQLNKRKSKQQREAEVHQAMTRPETDNEKCERHERQAIHIYTLAKAAFANQPEKFSQFLELLTGSQGSTVEVFPKLHTFCAGHPNIQDALFDTLTAEDALSLGNCVYLRQRERAEMKQFFRKLKIFYECQGQSQMYNKVLKELNNNQAMLEMDESQLRAFANKLFKQNQHLVDIFMSFIPNSRCPDSLLPAPEVMDFDEVMSREAQKSSSATNNPTGSDKESAIHLGEPEYVDFTQYYDEDRDDDMYGGDNCLCPCHKASDQDSNIPQDGERGEDQTGDELKKQHCLHCSLKFINGKVYIRDGKSLKPAKIEYRQETLNKGQNRSHRTILPVEDDEDSRAPSNNK